MNIRKSSIGCALLAMLFATAAFAQAPAPAGEKPADAKAADGAAVVAKASKGAEAQLAKSVEELNALRAQIATEKLPIAQQLTGLEENVIQLRAESARVQRLVDAGALEIGTLKQEIKFKQDELTYIGSLLDEYARTFETKIGVGEQQVYGQSIETAKQAVENKTLSPAERFSRQTAFAGLTIKRLFDMVGGSRFAGVGVDTMGTVMNGQFAMIGPVALFRADSGTAGIAVTQPGSTNPLVRQLEGDIAGTIGPLVASGEGTLALDPSRGGALKELVQKTNIVHIFIKGGPIMWPMLLASCVGLAVVLERIIFLSIEGKRRSAKAQEQFFVDVNKGDMAAAVALAKSTKDAVVSTLGYALERRDQSMAHALTYAETRTMKRYRRGLAILDTVITLAPLLGLLGTVTGMMASFSSIGGDMGSPGAITGGISEALIATAFGLVIAMTCLIPFNYLNSRIEGMETEMLAAGEQLKLLVDTRPHAPRAAHGTPGDSDDDELVLSGESFDGASPSLPGGA